MLGKFEWEVIEGCPPDELERWLAFKAIQRKDRERTERHQQTIAEARRGSGMK